MKKNKSFSNNKFDYTSIIKWLVYVILIVYCISLLIPIFWMIITALKDYIEYYDNPFLLPKEIIFDNFPSAFSKLKIQTDTGSALVYNDIFDMITTSFLWSFGVAFLHVFMSSTVAYVIARYDFKGRNFIYLLGIFIMIIPIIGSTPSMMQVRKDLGIYNNILLTALTQNSTSFSGIHFLILYAAFKGISPSYSEAAAIDGAGHFSIMFKIILPMMLPTCAVIFVLSFLTHWNEYGTFMIWLPGYANLSYGIYLFQKDSVSYGATINEIMAGFFIAIIPAMTLYLLSQKLITSKFTVGGLKG